MKEILDSTRRHRLPGAGDATGAEAGWLHNGRGGHLRKAMGKKTGEEMAQQEQKFILGAVDRGIKTR